MKITKVRFYDICEVKNSSFLFRCSVVLDDCLALNDIKVLSGRKGLYVVMPESSIDKRKSGVSMNFKSDDVFHPVNKRFFLYMSDIILDGYQKLREEGDSVYYPN